MISNQTTKVAALDAGLMLTANLQNAIHKGKPSSPVSDQKLLNFQS